MSQALGLCYSQKVGQGVDDRQFHVCGAQAAVTTRVRLQGQGQTPGRVAHSRQENGRGWRSVVAAADVSRLDTKTNQTLRSVLFQGQVARLSGAADSICKVEVRGGCEGQVRRYWSDLIEMHHTQQGSVNVSRFS